MVTSGEHSPGRFLAHELSRATIAAIVIAAAATGCRSGTSAMSAPSWWSFGGKNTDPERLSAAPPFTGEIKKPSASATPYPTTNMPNTYSLADAASGPPAQPVAPPAEPGTVTYGTRPSAPEAPLASTAPAAAAAPDAAGKPQISAQVGPYASLADATPPAAASNVTPPPAVPAPAVPFASAPPASAAPPATFPATAGYEPSQAARGAAGVVRGAAWARAVAIGAAVRAVRWCAMAAARPVIRAVLVSAACAARLAAAERAPGPEANPGLQVVYRGACVLPDSVPAADGTAVPLTGLSGITWVGGDRYVAVLDNSRIVIRFRLALAPNGSPLEARAFEVVTLAERHDYEDVAPRLGGGGGVFVCEEDTPAVRAFRLPDGTADGEVVLPGAMRGMRPNRGPEALALDPDGLHLWTANEEALAADVGPPGSAANSIVRIARLPLDRGGTPLQVAYRVDPPHDFVPVAAGESLSGLVALVALGRGRLLVLERSAGPGLPPFESRLYLVDASRAVDVSRVERGLADRPEAVVGKTLLWSDALGMNLEGLCLGPKLAASRRALVGIADNGGLRTPTQVTGLELVAVTNP